MSAKRLFVIGATVLLVGSSVAIARQGGILFPDLFPPNKGTFQAPAGDFGKKPAQAWSSTTVAAGVDAKPLAGKVDTVVGEIVDLSCYLQLGKHGQKHRDCGQKCLRNGQPIGIVTRDGSIYTLMEEEHDPRRDSETNLRDAAIEQMANIVAVTGTLSTVQGQKAIYVTGFLKN